MSSIRAKCDQLCVWFRVLSGGQENRAKNEFNRDEKRSEWGKKRR